MSHLLLSQDNFTLDNQQQSNEKCLNVHSQGIDILDKVGGLHKFMSWNRNLLTDSGGFQMVSLLELAEIDEHGVNFKSPYDGSQCMLTPEHSIKIQNSIGADIIMQLDDVIKTTSTGPRVEEAMHRFVLHLCIHTIFCC